MSIEERQRLIELERRVLRLELMMTDIVSDLKQLQVEGKSQAGNSGDSKPESGPIAPTRETLRVPKRG